MHDLAGGFRIDEHLFSWGTTLGEVAARLGLEPGDAREVGYGRLRAPCRSVFGLAALVVELTSAGWSRPVTALCYELAPPAGWIPALSDRLGMPDQDDAHEVPPHGDPSGSVSRYASWRRGTHSVGISVYGGLRAVGDGKAAGCLWLSWSSTAAAEPFLDDRAQAAADLAILAAAPLELRKFTLAVEQLPRFRDEADYALSAPHILPTPPSLGTGLGKHGFAFARIGAGDRWCLSTRWDSVAFPLGQAVTVNWYDVLPAKGGGHSEIAVEGWSVRDVSGSRVIEQALTLLKTLPGVTIRHDQSYDC